MGMSFMRWVSLLTWHICRGVFVFIQIATGSRRPRPAGTGSNVALKAPLTVESPGYCPHFLELWGSPVLYYSISLVAVSTRLIISPFVHVCITWREITTNLTPLSSVPLYPLVGRAPPWAPSKPQLGGAGRTLDLCPEVPSDWHCGALGRRLSSLGSI